ncbi:MAG: hypothetical protein GF329_20385 [Candidatus Lokiarchaeota archaeon]|nr:hypothetical protein [Candidatus Lokiarchaeota archaeon]
MVNPADLKVEYNKVSFKCPHCGLEIVRTGFFCPNCDTFNDSDSYYCKRCGKQIVDEELQKLKELKVEPVSDFKYSVKMFGEDRYKIKSKESEEVFNTILTKQKNDSEFVLLKNRCPNCLRKISDKEIRKMKKGYKVKCKNCDYELN